YLRSLGVGWTGHIILAADGRPIRSMAELTALVGRASPGDRIVLTVTVGPGILTGQAVVQLEPNPGGDGAPPTPPRAPRRR
ncbi:MAG: hypothetical protein IT379_32140, partial [Deltaproteobacteria bacterium]|nr:hypothetical protein [Deltaproteobacteria bacterium]